MGVLFSVVLLLWYLSSPSDAVLGRVGDSAQFHDIRRHSDAVPVPGLLVYRFSGPLFFANAERFVNRIEALALMPDELALQADPPSTLPVRQVVIDASGITGLDLSGLEALLGLRHRLSERGIGLSFAEAIGPVRDSLMRGCTAQGVEHVALFSSIEAGVRAGIDAMVRPSTTPQRKTA